MIWRRFIKLFGKKKMEEKVKVKEARPEIDNLNQRETYEKYKNRELSWLSFNERV